MKRINGVFVCMVLIAFILGLAGLSLADAQAAEPSGGDRLVGLFITPAPLDLPEGRLYAALTDKVLTDEETGETSVTQEYVFHGVAGFPFFYAVLQDESGAYQTAIQDDAISDAHVAFSSTSDGNLVTMEGTIYINPDKGGQLYYMNPVYLAADGRVFTEAGSGILAKEMQSQDSAWTHTLESETSVTANGSTQADRFSIRLTLCVLYPPEKITVLQLDENSGVVDSASYVPGQMPTSIHVDRRAAYLILECSGTEFEVSRALYQPVDAWLTSYYGRADGICVAQDTQLLWE